MVNLAVLQFKILTFFYRKQQATVIRFFPELVPVYIHAILFDFVVSDFCIKDAAEHRTITKMLYFLIKRLLSFSFLDAKNNLKTNNFFFSITISVLKILFFFVEFQDSIIYKLNRMASMWNFCLYPPVFLIKVCCNFSLYVIRW